MPKNKAISAKCARTTICEEKMIEIARSGDSRLLFALALNPHCTDSILSYLFSRGDSETKQCILNHDNVGERTLMKAVSGRDSSIAYAAITRTKAAPPESVMLKALDHRNIQIRRSTAWSDYATEAVMLKAVNDVNSSVVNAALSQKDCPLDALRFCADHACYSVRFEVASHQNCPEDILRKLMNDADEEVRGAACRNDNLPRECQKSLMASDDVRIRQDIVCEFEMDSDIVLMGIVDEDSEVRRLAAGSPLFDDPVFMLSLRARLGIIAPGAK